MEKNVRLMEVKTAEGTHVFSVLLSVYITEKEIVLSDEVSEANKEEEIEPETKEEKPQTNQQNTESPMTDAQKRFLFRILMDKGIEGDKALEHLKSLFQVDSLKEITKLEASRMIERLLNEAKGGEDHGSPF